MAFCPHCGKPAGDQATKCVACGKSIAPPQVGARGGFKGTMMMMSPAAVTKPKVERQDAAPARVPAAPSPAAKPAPKAAKPAAGAASTEEPKTGNRPAAVKATMIGGVGLGAQLGTPPAAQAAATAEPPPAADAAQAPTERPAPPPAAVPPAAGDTVAAFGKTAPAAPRAVPAKPSAPGPQAAAPPAAGAPMPTGGAKAPVETGGLLAGDPMAAAEPNPPQLAEPPRPAMRQSFDYEPTEPKSWKWVAAGFVGMVVIAGCGLLVAKLMGLL